MSKVQSISRESKAKEIENRVRLTARYMIEHKPTIRDASKVLNINKSTIHMDITNRLKVIDYESYKLVREILDNNKKARYAKGGLATKEKYKLLKIK